MPTASTEKAQGFCLCRSLESFGGGGQKSSTLAQLFLRIPIQSVLCAKWLSVLLKALLPASRAAEDLQIHLSRGAL